jgi:sec-independent protein translocase protein TatA
MPSFIGPWELILVLIVALLVFGPKRLPEMGKSLGKGMREFKDSISGEDKEHESHDTPPVTQAQALPPAAPPQAAAPTPPPTAERSSSGTPR